MMRLFLFNLTFFAMIGTVVPGFALGLTDRKCSLCHTMHNSQDGSIMTSPGDGPYGGLLRTDCIGCHTGSNAGGSDPFVLDIETPSTSLAGGNFWWVANGSDAKGHNVAGIASTDSEHGLTPPGGTAMASQLTCAGIYGCHGEIGAGATSYEVWAIKKGHHYNEAATLDSADTVANSYRFLLGIQGYEDPNWEYTASSSDHNEYYGVDRSGSADSTSDSATVSYLCARCHGDYHSTASQVSNANNMTSPWVRHPTDFAIGSATGSEYSALYGESYNVTVPLASNNLTSVPTETVGVADANIVMCLSCHRAHGSPNDSLMRWNYKNWPTDPAQNGCQQCHTTKN